MPAASPTRAVEQTRSVFVARQAIFDRSRSVIGYELLYRRDELSLAAGRTNSEVTPRVICDAVLAVGLDALVENRKAFINVDEQFLLDGIPPLGDPSGLVLELSRDIGPTPDVLEACRRIRAEGYGIALDDFDPDRDYGALLTLADHVKVDAVSAEGVRGRHTRGMGLGRATPIAKRVETADAFAAASEDGYRLFQGFFFGKPIVKEGRAIAPQQVSRLRLLQALRDPDLTTRQLEELVKRDPALCYRILRTVNSAGFALPKPPASIGEALLLLGRDAVLRWASLWVLSSATGPGQRELLALSIIRARCSEVLASSGDNRELATEAFLTGLCSLLDVILERPMPEVLDALNLPERMSAALRGEPNYLRATLDCVTAYAAGDWTRSGRLADELGLDHKALPPAYGESLRWVRELQ